MHTKNRMSIEISKIIQKYSKKIQLFVSSEIMIISFMTFLFLKLVTQLPSSRPKTINI
jgi:hypothetical protein